MPVNVAVRTAVLGGVAGPVLFTIVTILAAAGTPGYSHAANFVSELGVPGAPHAPAINYAGFVPAGLLLGAFGLALGRTPPPERFRWVVSLLVTVFTWRRGKPCRGTRS